MNQWKLLSVVVLGALIGSGCGGGRKILSLDLDNQGRRMEEISNKKEIILEEKYYSSGILIYSLNFQEFSHWEMFQKAEKLLNRGVYKEALAHFEQAVGERPDNPMLHFKLGIIYERLGKAKEALIRYKAAAARLPLDDGLAIALGNSLINFKHPKEALPLFNQVLAKHPKNLGALYGQALAYFYLNDKAKAGATVAQLLKLHPKFAEAKILQNRIVETR